MRLYSLAALILFCVCSIVQAQDLKLMPYPQQVDVHSGSYVLPKRILVNVQGNQSAIIDAALSRFAKRVALQTNLSVSLKNSSLKKASIVIHLSENNREAFDKSNADKKNIDNVDVDVDVDVDESYQLTVSKKQITINANSESGAMHGLETLLQLIGTQKRKIEIPQLAINDFPRFKWRGLLLDTARHFFSVDTIKRQIDGMAAAKLNIFHWHLTDDQGWRLESKKFSKLQQLASDGEFYTQAEIRDVVSYAKQHGIQVLPEVDMPGHASALALAYPELMSAPGPYEKEIGWGVHKPTMNATDEKVYAFIDELIGEITELFPFEYIHIGGDEVDPTHWNTNSEIQNFMLKHGQKNPHDLQAYFNQRVEKILEKHNRKMIGWDEIQHPELPQNIIVQSWRGPDAVSDAVHNGFQAILSTGYYLDQAQPASYHYRIDPLPVAPYLEDKINPGEQWQTWSFVIKRKRGDDLTGSFTLITMGDKSRGFIDLKNKSRRAINNIQHSHGDMEFSLDTWMGEITFDVTFNNKILSGSVIVANAPYKIRGEQIAGSNHSNKILPTGIKAAEIDAVMRSKILGGEAALWAEIVDEQSLDLRLWPRAFVVGERLWSSETLVDENSMYDRMQAISNLSSLSIGLQQNTQTKVALEKLAGSKNIEPLQALAETLEQAQYYHRQHEKSTYATYSKDDPLNLFVDALPPENVSLRNLDKLVTDFISTRDEDSKNKLSVQFLKWKNNNQPLIELLKTRQELGSLKYIAEKVDKLSELALFLIEKISTKVPLSQAEIDGAKALIDESKEIYEEIVIAIVYRVEKLLNAAY